MSSTPQISFQDVLQLVELLKSSANFSELRIRSGDLEIDVRRGSSGSLAALDRSTSVSPSPSAAPASEITPAASSAPVAKVSVTAPLRSAASAVSRQGSNVVRAPMVGTIYHAPEPGAAPFVRLGDQVAAGDQLCIIEVMKLMNAVTADEGGTVSEILVNDGEAVEFGQDLYVIAPR